VTAVGAQSTMQADVYFTDTTGVQSVTVEIRESTCTTATSTFTAGQTVCANVTVTATNGGGRAGSFFIDWVQPDGTTVAHETTETVPSSVPTVFQRTFAPSSPHRKVEC